MTKVYGIDLGTTYSCIAHVDDNGTVSVIPNKEGEIVTPSVVYFEESSGGEPNVVVGQVAREEGGRNPDRVVVCIKRSMGDPDYKVRIDGQEYGPAEISMMILKKVVADASEVVGEPITDVVITCPAYFGSNQRELTAQAGELAGLVVRQVIEEPVAAAFAYGLESTKNETVLVYDLGGGTFDVTVIKISNASANVREPIKVICTVGDNHLGGKDWDDLVFSYLVDRYEAETGRSGSEIEGEAAFETTLTAEKLKRKLTSMLSASERVTGADGHGTARPELDRKMFDRLTESLLDRTIDYTKDAISKAAEKGVKKIDRVLLVGGSTYMPQVKARVQKEFPGVAIQLLDPNQIVAKGAALIGRQLQLHGELIEVISTQTGESSEDIDLDKVDEAVLDAAQNQVAARTGMEITVFKNFVNTELSTVAPKSFGVKVVDKSFADGFALSNLVVANQPIPLTSTTDFVTFENNQKTAQIEIFENLSPENASSGGSLVSMDECTQKLGEAVLEFTRPLPKGSPIRVTFELSRDGRLSLHAEDLTTKQEIRETFKTDTVMSNEELAAAHNRAKYITVR